MFGQSDHLPGLLIIVLVVIAFIAVRRYAVLRRVRDAHALVAQNYRGRVMEDNWRRPWTEFHTGGERVTVSVYREPGGGVLERLSTHVHITWPNPPHWLYLRTRTFFSELSGWLESSNKSLGDAWFRKRFRVRTTDPQATRDLLSTAMQRHLEGLRTFAHAEKMSLLIANGILHIRVTGALDETGELLSFVEQVLACHAEALGSFKVGIEFTGPELPALPLLAGAVCQICGDPITGEPVFCGTCRTPHHRECWQYNGQCAIFGCRETHYTSVEVVKR